MPYIATRQRIFTNELAQDVAILATVTVSLATLAYFYYEIRKNKLEHEKNKLELVKLQHELAAKNIDTNTSNFNGNANNNSYPVPRYNPKIVTRRMISPYMA